MSGRSEVTGSRTGEVHDTTYRCGPVCSTVHVPRCAVGSADADAAGAVALDGAVAPADVVSGKTSAAAVSASTSGRIRAFICVLPRRRQTPSQAT
jgi:hypothetical protein